MRRARTSLLRRTVMWTAGVVLMTSALGMGVLVSGVDFELIKGSLVLQTWKHTVLPDGDTSSWSAGSEGGWVWPKSGFERRWMGTWSLTLPLWMPATAAISVIFGVRLVEHRTLALRARKGLCPSCGYSLAGIDGPCPECGRERKAPA